MPQVTPAAHRAWLGEVHAANPQPSYSSSNSSKAADPRNSLPRLPPKRGDKITRNLRWSICSVYRRLNTLVILPNFLIIVVLGAKHELLTTPTTSVATAVSINLTLAVLIRQDLIINALFAICGMCPSWVPLCLRRLIAKIYHLGGVHSGAAIAAVLWFGIFNMVLIKEWQANIEIVHAAGIFVITGILDCLLLSIIVFAHPWLRAKFHNAFEFVHRFAGWLAVVLFWVHMIILANAQRRMVDPTPSLARVTFQAPAFWCLLVVSVSLVLPWLRLRKVPVHVEHLSSHAVRMYFTHETLPLCAAPKISDDPLKEWHAFAGIPQETGKGYSILVSRAGDWTQRMIRNPPTSLWVRGIPSRGVLHMAPIFKRLVLVATGSGIGPILSLLSARNLNCRILWSASRPVLTYKKAIVDAVLLGDPHAVMIDTSLAGRPDLIYEAYTLYKTFNAEAVFVISNATVTRKVVYGLESRQIPTFAPIFDS